MSAFFVTPTTLTLNFFAWAIRSSGLEPAALSATTVKSDGLASTISRA